MGRHVAPTRDPDGEDPENRDTSLDTASEELEEARAARVRQRTTRIALLVIVAVLTVLGVEVALLLRNPAGPAPADRATSSAPDLRGWASVQDTDTRATYRVPPSFTVQDDLTEMAFGQVVREVPDRVELHTIAIYRFGSCPGPNASHRGMAGFVSQRPGRSDDPAVVAAAAARQATTHRDGTTPEVAVPHDTPLTLADGTVARQAVVTVPVTEPYPCSPPSLQFTAVALPVGGETAVFLLATDRGTDDALPEPLREEIVRSLDVAGT